MSSTPTFDKLWGTASRIVALLEREMPAEQFLGNAGTVLQMALGKLHAGKLGFTDDPEKAWESLRHQDFMRTTYVIAFNEQKRRNKESG